MTTTFAHAFKYTQEGCLLFDLSDFQMNERIAPAIIQTLSETKNITNLKLKQSNVSASTLKQMLQHIEIQVLDISNNQNLDEVSFE